nr:MAG TPA: hypothetical protein [Bacteriophage sp.]
MNYIERNFKIIILSFLIVILITSIFNIYCYFKLKNDTISYNDINDISTYLIELNENQKDISSKLDSIQNNGNRTEAMVSTINDDLNSFIEWQKMMMHLR